MLEIFEVVRGSVADDGLIPILSHFAFNNGRVYGCDGRLLVSAPCKPLKHLSLAVMAVPFLAALRAAGDKVTCNRQNDPAALIVQGGAFNASLPFVEFEQFPLREPIKAKPKKLAKDFLRALALLRPIIGEDASRPWSATIRLGDEHAIATNNILLAAMPITWPHATIALPVFAVDELLRIGLEPDSCAVDERGVEFTLPGGIKLYSSFLSGDWPDALLTLHKVHEGATPIPTNCAAIADALELVTPFCGDQKLPRVKLENATISAVGGAMQAAITGFSGFGAACMTFHVKPLTQALTLSQALDWTRFPRVPFVGEHGIRGVLIGVPR